MDRYSTEEATYLGLTTVEFKRLLGAALVCSTISLFASITTCITFIYMLYIQRQRAKRVSLWCVLLAAKANTMACIINIVIIVIPDSSSSCLSLGVAYMFFSILSTGFLTIVGINLLIVFVLNVKTDTHRLQLAYYPTVLLWGLISIIVPTYIIKHPCVRTKGHASCWFDIYFESSHCGDSVWIWHYSFLMFLVVLGISCSVIATMKLIREQYIKFGTILRNRPEERRHQSALIVRVLFRCVLYSLIPFISNIWGFVSQTVVFKEGVNTPYQLAMFGVIFRCLEGVFIVFIFYTDPTVTSILSEQVKKWYCRYVEEYLRMNIVQYEHLDIQNHVDLIRDCEQCNQLETTPAPLIHDTEEEEKEEEEEQYGVCTKKSIKREMKSVPVRCVNIPPCMHNRSISPHSSFTGYSTLGDQVNPLNSPNKIYRISPQDPHLLERKGASPILTCDHPDSTKAYIPYRYPRLATFLHHFFTLFKSNHKTPNDNLVHPQVQDNLQHPVPIHVPEDAQDLSDAILRPPCFDYTPLSPCSTPSPSPSFSAGQL